MTATRHLRRRRQARLFAAAATFAVAACGSGNDVAGWLGDDTEGVVFVSWTRHGDELTGVVTRARLVDTWSSDTPVDVAVESADFTGVVNGDSVALTFDGWSETPWRSRVVTGTVGGDTLTLAVPSDDGLDTIRLEEGTSDDFNAAAARLRDLAAEHTDRARLTATQLELADVEAEAESLLATLRGQYAEAERLFAVVRDEADDEPPDGWAGMDALAAYEVQWAADEVRWGAADGAEAVASDLRSVAARGYELVAEVVELAQRLDQRATVESARRFDRAADVAAAEEARSHLDEIVADSEDVRAATVALVEAADRLAAEAWGRSAAEGGPDGPGELDW